MLKVVPAREISQAEKRNQLDAVRRVYKALFPFVKPVVQLVPDLALAFDDAEKEIENGQVSLTIVRIVNAIGVSCRDPVIAEIEQLNDLYKDNYKGLWILLSILAPEYLLNCKRLENP